MTPAEEIRTAVDKLNKLAAQATQGPWETTWRGQEYHLDGYRNGTPHSVSEWTYAVATWEPQASEQRADCDTADPDYMAAMNPAVGKALADWLQTWVGVELRESAAMAVDAHHALAVARAINGDQP